MRLVKAFRSRTGGEKTSGLRSCLMIAKVCAEHNILVSPQSSDFREICADVLFNRTNWSASEAATIFLELLNHLDLQQIEEFKNSIIPEDTDAIAEGGFPTIIDSHFGTLDSEVLEQPGVEDSIPFEQEIYLYLQQYKSAALALVQQEFELSRTVATNALNSLEQKGLVSKNNHVYTIEEPNQS